MMGAGMEPHLVKYGTSHEPRDKDNKASISNGTIGAGNEYVSNETP